MREFHIDLNLPSNRYDDTDGKILARALRRQRLFSKKFLYSFFDRDDFSIEQVAEFGTYRPGSSRIFAFTNLQITGRENLGLIQYFSLDDAYAGYENPGLIVFKGSFFEHFVDYAYDFKDPKNRPPAIEAIATVSI